MAILFNPIKNAVRLFFRQDLKLRRGEAGVRLVLEDRALTSPGRPLTRAEIQVQKEERQFDLARADLARVLDEEPRGRTMLRQLAFVEHALEKKGWRGLYKLPLPVLQKGLEQLEQQVTNWAPEGLACLRSKMAVAVIDRGQQGGDPAAEAYRTAAVLESPPMAAVQVIELASAESIAEDDAELLAAYASLGVVDPVDLKVEGEPASPSAQSSARESVAPANGKLELRELQGG